jgi:PPOX class probable F420-dependent enzyme
VSLADARYISLTTFRRDGSTASTPVWVVSDDGRRLLVWTGRETWKAKRIRRDPRVRVARCTASGKLLGHAADGTARFVDEAALVRRLLREKYGLQKRALDAFNGMMRRLRGGAADYSVYIEIVVDGT